MISEVRLLSLGPLEAILQTRGIEAVPNTGQGVHIGVTSKYAEDHLGGKDLCSSFSESYRKEMSAMQRIGVSDDLYERMRFYASEQNVSIEALIVSVLKALSIALSRNGARKRIWGNCPEDHVHKTKKGDA